MNSKINLSKIKQCNQIWDSMQLCEKDRLCNKCNNIIIDFRGKTEREIALKHAQSEKKVCGLYDKKVFTKHENLCKQSINGNIILAGTLGLLTTNSPVFSQNEKEQFKTQITLDVDKGNYSYKSNTENNELNKDSCINQINYSVTGVLTEKLGEPLKENNEDKMKNIAHLLF